MATYYLWIKGLHIVFMVTWFAGLFYLPRLFIYHTATADDDARARFVIMERRLFAITSIGASLTILFGLGLVALNPPLGEALWLQVKLLLVVGLLVYQFRCWRWMQRLKTAAPDDDTTWLRWFNEIPVLFLLGIILLAVVKPF